MFNDLLKNVMNLGIITEDDVKRLTAVELMLLIIERTNGILVKLNNYIESNDVKVNELIEQYRNLMITLQEIATAQMNAWIEDGTMETLINKTALATVNRRIDETNIKLGGKMNKGDQFNITQLNKNGGLIDETYLADSLKQQITGTTPIGSIPADNSITSSKLTDGCVHFLKTAEPLSELIIFESAFDCRFNTDTKIADIRLFGKFSTEANNLGTFVLPYSQFTLGDGQHLVLDYPNKTIIVENVLEYITAPQKYILVSSLGGRLYSSIPMINDIINQKGKQPPITPWELPFVIDNPDETKTIRLKGVFIRNAEINSYFALEEETDFILNDGDILYYNGLDGFSIQGWDTYDPQSHGEPVVQYLNHKLYSSIPLYQYYFNHMYYPLSEKGTSPQSTLFTVDKSGSGDYRTITDAVNGVNDSSDNPVTILIQPGVYKESVRIRGNRHISLIGVNKNTCIIQTDGGQYENPPLEIQGDSYIANLTIIATHNDNLETDVDGLRAYAVHCDYEGDGTTEFNNCLMISHQNASIGCGLHNNQTLKIVNCELISKTPTQSSMTTNGALFVHDGQGASNQKLIVKDSIIKSENGYSMYLNGYYGTEVDATFYNNIFWSNTLKKGNDSIHRDAPAGGISKNIKLTEDSYGNNVEILNS